MPHDRWADAPTPVNRRAAGYDLALHVTPGHDEESRWHEGLRLHVAALTAPDIRAAIDADPDATPEHLTEALTIALDATAPSIQAQIDDLTDVILMGGL